MLIKERERERELDFKSPKTCTHTQYSINKLQVYLKQKMRERLLIYLCTQLTYLNHSEIFTHTQISKKLYFIYYMYVSFSFTYQMNLELCLGEMR